MTDLSPALMRFGDVSVRLSVELGRTDMPLRDVLSLGQGSVVSLNRLTDELLDITANGKVVAQGEVIEQGGKFALRIVNLVGEEPGASATPSPAAIGTGFPEASRAATAPVATEASAAPPPTQSPAPSSLHDQAPPSSPPVSPAPVASSEAEKNEVEEPESPPEPVPQAPAQPGEPAPPSEAEPDGLDDLLDSTLDELTDALDDITPAEGSDKGEAG